MSQSGRNLVICSDGTGNSGRGTVGTNVWRIRQAVQAFDQHHGEVEQHIIYQDGVGTQAFKPLKILGLAFSYGVTQDLEYLYERLMLQYQEGDRIFLFGFSRGAFTIRTLGYILYLCGLADPFDEHGQRRSAEEIRQIAKDAVITYKMRHLGYHVTFREKYGRTLKEPQRPAWGPKANQQLPAEETKGRVRIEFVGVWDTVSSVGLPFHNFTQAFLSFWRGITTFWMFRWAKLSLLNFRRPTNRFWTRWEDDLHPYIANAYHALSLDDERDTFYPMLWLENLPVRGAPVAGCRTHSVIARRMSSILRTVTSRQVSAISKKDPGDGVPGLNVEQVWFAGMHSDVGGGYDKDHLAHVSLMWMIAHARRCGLKFSEDLTKEYAERVDALGKMHDSRSGPALLYRYNPRDVEWFSHDVGISGQAGDRPLIHDSVFCRIADSSQAYAPRHIPFAERYEVIRTPKIEGDPKELPANSPRLSWDPEAPAADRTPELNWKLQNELKATARGSEDQSSGMDRLTAAVRSVLRVASILLFGVFWIVNLIFAKVVGRFGKEENQQTQYLDARQYADETIHLYVVLRRAAARWIVYVILIFIGLALSTHLLDGCAELDNGMWGSLGTLHRNWYAGGLLPWKEWSDLVPVLRLSTVLCILFFLFLASSVVGMMRLKRRDTSRKPFQSVSFLGQLWPVFAPFATAIAIFAGALVLRPLAHSLVDTFAPGPVSKMIDALMKSGVAFGIMCAAVFGVFWFNGHYRRRIENWARYAWDSQVYGAAARPEAFEIWPRSLVEALFSERRLTIGRYIGRFATKTFFPLLSMSLLGLAVAALLWIPMAEVLIGASLQWVDRRVVEPAALVTQTAVDDAADQQAGVSETISWDANRTLNTRRRVVEGRHYVIRVKIEMGLSDGVVPGNLHGIDLTQQTAAEVESAPEKEELQEDGPQQPSKKEKPTLAEINRGKEWMSRVSALKRLPSEDYFQLCAAVGSPVAASQFPILPDVPFTAPASGELFLFLNDVPGFYVNNRGRLQVQIETVRLPR
ncbi:MAG: hypothetical protein Fues2KO_35320 [Fuerstiella sp.]